MTTFRFDPARNGVYAAPADTTALRAAAHAAHLAWHRLDLGGVADKPAFLARCAQALGLPAHFGANWDALADCLGDGDWLAPAGALVDWRSGGAFARAAPEALATALEIFGGAASYWQGRQRVFVVLVAADSGGASRLPAWRG